MKDSDREAILSAWIKPSSSDEVLQQERAQRMVDQAVTASNEFARVSKKIYAKGSYANNTNVRQDSDVDIVVECHECTYYDTADGVRLCQGRWASTRALGLRPPGGKRFVRRW